MRPGGFAWLMLAAFIVPMSASADDDPPIARITWPDGQLPPARVHVTPPTIRFGEIMTLVVEAESGFVLPPAEELAVDVDWLVLDLQASPRGMPDLPEAAGPRMVLPMRVYHLGPWRLAWGDSDAGDTLMVEGRLTSSQEIMPVRDPRAIGGLPRWLPWILALAAVAVIMLLLSRRLRRGRFRPTTAGRPLPPPAWLSAALDLRDLDRSSEGRQQAGRLFLDRLAHILRLYIQRRYHLPALEMTAKEIRKAAVAAGWPAGPLAGFCELLGDCDHLRYAPDAVSALACREGFITALDLIEDVRIVPVWSPVAPGTLAEAAAAWRELRSRYPRRTSPREQTAC
jgi:hypothetical protein